MKIVFGKADKILSIANSLLGILVVLFTHLFKSEWFNYSVILAIAIVAITIIILALRVRKQSLKIDNQAGQLQELRDQQEAIKKDLELKEERIALLEKLMNVPFFKKWNLIYTFMWRNAISLLSNPVVFYEIHVSRRLHGTGKIKDNHVTYAFLGECLDSINSFHFCVAGLGNIPLEKIGFKVMDMTTNTPLGFAMLKNSKDSDIKYVEVYFRKELQKKDIFNLEFSWQWPKTAYNKSGYFSIPNIYSESTKRLILDLYPTQDMSLSTVETYKFGIDDMEPSKINHLYMNDAGYYHAVIDNPEKDADYITYYEQ